LKALVFSCLQIGLHLLGGLFPLLYVVTIFISSYCFLHIKPVLSDMTLSTTACHWSPHDLYIFSQLFIFTLCVYLVVTYFSCRKQFFGTSFDTFRQSVSFDWRVNSVYI
jgi:hypothetical protein